EAEQVCDRVMVISKGRALATGPPDELRRARPVVRFRVSGLAPGWWQPLANGARWKDEGGDWLLAEDLDPARIPDVVAGAVALGGRVEAVVPEPIRRSDVILGKWAGLAVLLAAYSLLVTGVMAAVVHAVSGFTVPNVLAAAGFLFAEGAVLLTLVLLLSTRLSALAAGVIG